MSLQVLNHAILSEKAYKQMEKGTYTFLVGQSANKSEIKKAVETQFGVRVKNVNIAKIGSKSKRIAKSRKTVSVGGGKKAIVTLTAGQTIGMLSPKSESKKEKATKVKKDSKETESKKGFLGRIRKSDKTTKSDTKSKR